VLVIPFNGTGLTRLVLLLLALMLFLGLIYLMKSPKLLMFHYPLDYRLDREGLLVDALVELLAEPVAVACKGAFFRSLETSTHVLDRADFEVCVIHKLLIARPHGPLSLFASLHRSLLPEIKIVDLSHRGEVDEVCGIDHYPRMLLFLPALKPHVEFVINEDRSVVLVKLPIRFCFRSPNLA